MRIHSEPAAQRPRRCHFGFTLVELVLTVSVLAILTAATAPAFTSIVNQNRLSSAANEMVASLQLARAEAMRRNARVVLCRSADPNAASPACATGSGDWTGWIAFVDGNRNGSPDAGEPILSRHSVSGPVSVRASSDIAAADDRVVFRPDGRAKNANGSLLAAKIGVCVNSRYPSRNARDVTLAFGSRISIAHRDGDGGCPAPGNT